MLRGIPLLLPWPGIKETDDDGPQTGAGARWSGTVLHARDADVRVVFGPGRREKWFGAPDERGGGVRTFYAFYRQ